jgi:hypothetical protein
VLAAAASPRLLRTFNSVGAELRLLIAQLRPALEAWQAHLGAAERFFLDLIKEHGL